MKRIYFDHYATSPLYQKVKNEMIKIMNHPLNPSSTHMEGRKARYIIEITRKIIKEILLLDNNYQIIFTSSCTESNNLVNINFINNINISSSLDHQSIKNLDNKVLININKNGFLYMKYLQYLIKKKYIISLTYANNEIGVLQFIKKAKFLLKDTSNLLHCDITQSLGKININVKNIDLITFGCHKFGGPFGVGCLVYKKKIDFNPIFYGGNQEHGVRSGTHNVVAIKGLYQSFCCIKKIQKSFFILKKLRDNLEKIILSFNRKIRIISKNTNRLPNVSYIFMPNVKSEVQVIYFDINSIAVSHSSACSSTKSTYSSLLKTIGIKTKIAEQSLRISLGPRTQDIDISIFIYFWKKLFDIYNKN